MKDHKLVTALLGLLLFIFLVIGIAIGMADDPPLDGTKER